MYTIFSNSLILYWIDKPSILCHVKGVWCFFFSCFHVFAILNNTTVGIPWNKFPEMEYWAKWDVHFTCWCTFLDNISERRWNVTIVLKEVLSLLSIKSQENEWQRALLGCLFPPTWRQRREHHTFSWLLVPHHRWKPGKALNYDHFIILRFQGFPPFNF